MRPPDPAWFIGSQCVDSKGRPLVLYRGTRGHAGDPFVSMLDTPSFVEDPRIASVYAHRIGGDWHATKLTPVGSVHPVYLAIKNPVNLSWPDFADGLLDLYDLLGAWRFGEPDGATPKDVLRVLKGVHRRQAGKGRGTSEFLCVVYTDRDKEELDEDSSIYFDLAGQLRAETPLSRVCEEWSDGIWDDLTTAEFKAIAYRVRIDTFAVCDTPAFREVSVRLGFDGVVHDDVMSPYLLEMAGYDPDDFETGEDPEGHEAVLYVTWRPFAQDQVRSVWR